MSSRNVRVSTDQIKEVLSYAVLAPSSHNTQPWRFEVSAGIINLFADRSRALAINDPYNRELAISCGCALMNLRVAAAHLEVDINIIPFPDSNNHDLLATVCFEKEASSSDLSHLYNSIKSRRTYRKHFAPNEIAPSILSDLSTAANHEGCWLSIIESEETWLQVAQLVFEGDVIQWSNPEWRKELASWMHPRRLGDGLTVPAFIASIAKIVVQTFNMGKSVGAKDKQLSADSPVLAVIGTREDDAKNWLATGQALQKVLLMADSLGLQASFMNQPIQVDSLRPELQKLLQQTGLPQILIRLGYPDAELKAAPRRPLDDVIFFK